jgi:hypothetical protein
MPDRTTCFLLVPWDQVLYQHRGDEIKALKAALKKRDAQLGRADSQLQHLEDLISRVGAEKADAAKRLAESNGVPLLSDVSMLLHCAIHCHGGHQGCEISIHLVACDRSAGGA